MFGWKISILFLTVLVSLAGMVHASATIPEAIDAAAGLLTMQQSANGSWMGSEAYSGSIAAGLVNAYQVTGNSAYKTTAESAGTYILQSSFYGDSGFLGFYGDEAYGLTRLSETSADPGSNVWRTAVDDFYQLVHGVGTANYIASLQGGYGEDSQPLFYLAQHAIAAEYVHAVDKALWRQAVIDTLASVTDDDVFPVMSLGTAVAALAQTAGGLDSTVISDTGYWAGVTLEDLPAILASHQVSSGARAGSFYYRFDHAGDVMYEAEGYTEDTVFALSGLLAADVDSRWDFSAEILNARQVLVNGDSYGVVPPDYGVQSNGLVYDHIWSPSFVSYAFVGETLQVLPEPGTLVVLGLGSLVMFRRKKN